MSKKKKVEEVEITKFERVEFGKPFFGIGRLKDEPSCFNGMVNVRRWQTTVELVDEPLNVIHERLQKLWDESNNYHDYEPLKKEAAKYGYELKGSRGNKAK